MKVVQETCIAGRTIDRTVKVASGNHRERRSPKSNITSEQVQKNNDRLAVKNLMRLINANFGGGDIHAVLTYETAAGQKQAKKDRDTFIKSMRRAMKKQGKELKYIAVTEYEHTRIHHHIILSKVDAETIELIWKKGWVKLSVLDGSGNYAKLAAYLIKETQRTFRQDDCMHKRRYSASANLVRPVVTRRYVNESELFDDPQPIKGYYIDQEHCRRYEHPVTGLEHLEYIMVAIDKPRRFKRWPGERICTDREYFRVNYEEEQQSLWE